MRLASVILTNGDELHGVVLAWANMVPREDGAFDDFNPQDEVEFSFERVSNGDVHFIRASKVASITWTDHK